MATAGTAPAPSATQARPGRLRRWIVRLPLVLGLLSLAVWLLPPLIATTPLRNAVLNMAQAQLPKGMKVGSASLSWTRPVQLNDVVVEDKSGREVLRVER